ncbi:PadR family transcriptional regulator [Pseudonocardiaceae bacterium YIM PH 21723]|nr:PadR family transcriptional regulator [Pseudonocardiaceae bacterium YIM PH 21723]
MSATRLLVLGVVKLGGPVHGYAVRQELQSWGADKWANAAPGSIYHALKKMTQDGLLDAVDESDAGRPERIKYTITKSGETEFFLILRNILWDEEATTSELSAAVAFLTQLPREEQITNFGNRVLKLEHQANLAESTRESLGHSNETPDYVQELFHYWIALMRAQADWSKALIKRMQTGSYDFVERSPNHGPSHE